MTNAVLQNTRAHVFVRGRVQGVSFRESTRRVAQAREVRGWVRNLPDGRVEAVLEGERQRVEEVIQWMHEGPSLAVVEEVEIRHEDFSGAFTEFVIERRR